MSYGGERRYVLLRSLVIAAFWLTVVAAVCWTVSSAVGADWPDRPTWDLGHSGPWVASYTRAAAAGSWGAARVCLAGAGLVLLRELLDRILHAVGRFVRGE
ncbi:MULTISPECIES: hypothetical protein [unclassified Streptomyces]|uniref:hypothetical protein n=1 Tax=unclassified Streptomyces TaxID=2593676 RepID=UPI001F048CD0|nr:MULTISPECIES: hypothetical protein [unclassified Streptomyces]MCH0563055.1 hypothetical protein [Streptomyces sp. MUM 2J]MCH0570315.1 hypothetical protein [Streptomyces sp. MUM 136J]